MTAASFTATFLGALIEAGAGLAALVLVGCLVWGGAWWQARRESGAQSERVSYPENPPTQKVSEKWGKTNESNEGETDGGT